MKPNLFRVFRVFRGHLLREVIASLLFYGMLLQCAVAAAPGWWSTQGIIIPNKPADDYAALNQGQLKNFVRAAVYELHAKLPGGAGTLLNNLLHTWRTQQLNADDYAVVTVGQLKAVAQPVYQSMQAAKLPLPVPWTSLTTDDDDHAVANIGQAKAVFAFVVPDLVTLGMLDSDGDGFSDALELALGTNPYLASSKPGGSGDVGVGGGNGTGGGANGGGVGGGGGLPPYVDPYPEPWPDFDAAGTAAADKDTDNDGVKDAEDQVWYDPAFKGRRSGVPHYNIIDLGKCVGGFIDMADSGALVWQENAPAYFDPPRLRVWTPEHPGDENGPKEVVWDSEEFGLEDGFGAWQPGAISNAGRLLGQASQEIPDRDSKRRFYLYDPAAASAVWLPHLYPDEGSFQYWHSWMHWGPAFGPEDKVFGATDYEIYPEDEDEPRQTWTAFYRLSGSSATIEDKILITEQPPLPQEPPDVDNDPPGKRVKLESPAIFNTRHDPGYFGASGTGVIQVSRRQKRDVYKQVFMGDYYSSLGDYWGYSYEYDPQTYQPVYLEDRWTYQLVTASGTHVLKSIDAVGEAMGYSPWWFGYVSPAEQPWLVGRHTDWDTYESKTFIYTPDENGGNYQPHAIYASRKDYQAAKPIKGIGMITAQGQALVWGAFDADDPDNNQVPGLWADGEVQMMSKLIGGYDRYSEWYFNDVSRDGMLAATAKKQGAQGLEQHMLLLIPITTHEVKDDGTLAEAGGGVQASMPSPVFCASVATDGKPTGTMSCTLQNLRVLGDGSVVGDLQVSGSITSKACDNVKGTKGTITQAQLWVNGADTPQAVITVTPSKQNTGSVTRPYPYAGSFSTTIANVPLTGGNNVFKFTAEDPVYHMPGYSTWAVTVNVSDPEEDDEDGGGDGNPGGNFALTVQLPAATLAPASADTIHATLNLNGTAHANVPLTETAAASGVFSGVLADGRPARLALTGAAALAATSVDVMDATLLLGAPGSAATYRSGVRETGPASGVFTGGYVSSSIASTGGSGDSGGGASGSGTTNTGGSTGGGAAGGSNTSPPAVTVSADPYEGMLEVEKSNGGEFHRYAISVGVSEALKDHFKMAFGEGDDAEEFELMKDTASGLMVLKDPNQTSQPFTPSFKPSETPLPSESDAEHAKRLEEVKDMSAIRGFAYGMGYGGVDMVTGLGKIVWGGAKFVGRGFLAVGLQFKWAGQWMTGEDTSQTEQMLTEIGEAQWEVATQTYNVATFLNEIIIGPQTMLPKIGYAMLTDDKQLLQTALYGSESHRIMFMKASEAVTETLKDWDGTEGQKGYVTGRIVFEVLAFLLPFAKAKTLLQVSKAQVMEHLKNVTWLRPATRTVLNIGKAAIEGLCFEAGANIKTQENQRVPIEDVQAGMEVWSRSEITGEECLKHVLRTFVTHPTEMYRLTYEVRGPLDGIPSSPGVKSETLGVTAPHPFWVCNNEPPGFIAAEDLRIGDVLYVSEGREAVVTRNVLEHAKSGETFTTYNFEVEDFHTYFVGDVGVWVHNAGLAACEELIAAWRNLKAAGNAGIDAWANLERRLVSDAAFGEGYNAVARGKALTEVVRKELLPSHVDDFFAGATEEARLTNLWKRHVYKHIYDPAHGDMASLTTNGVQYVKRAVELSRTTRTTGNVLVAEGLVPRGTSHVLERIVLDKTTGEFTVLVLEGSDAGRLRTLFKIERSKNPDEFSPLEYFMNEVEENNLSLIY